MKRLVIIAMALVMVVGIGIGSASAANSLQQGNISIGVGMGDSALSYKPAVANDIMDLSARYLVTKDLAIVGGFGFQIGGGDVDVTYYSFTGGIRKYLKTTDFAPFVGGQLTYATYTKDNTAGATIVHLDDMNVIDLSAMFGAEYFVGPQFSLEGSVGIGFSKTKSSDWDPITGAETKTDETDFGSRTVGVKANFYF